MRIGLVLIVMLLAPPLWAGPATDYDGDGQISLEEFRNDAAREAKSADRNGNGVLDPDEYELSNAEVAAMDTNKDGAIQIAEFQDSLMKAFARMDANGDGRLDAAERSAR
jgi:Ca2+-binding EF-hand superfamily protein